MVTEGFRKYYDSLKKESKYDTALRFLARHPEIVDDTNLEGDIMKAYREFSPYIPQDELRTTLTGVFRDVIGDSKATLEFLAA